MRPRQSEPHAPHDHDACVSAALAAAERRCAARRARLTPLRRRVLELVWRSHRPVGAYAILEALAAQRDDGGPAAVPARPAPPTVYRALDFLLEHGLIHRIESHNAFIGCAAPTHRHGAQFLICTGCGIAAELDNPALDRAMQAAARRLGFTVAHATVEAAGLCSTCRAAA